MLRIVTAEEMREIDLSAIKKYSIPGMVLMENAGRAVVDHVHRLHGDLSSKVLYLFCGKGNNGGDGYVIARHLVNRGADVRVFLLCPAKEIRGDAKTNFTILQKMVAASNDRLRIDSVKSVAAVRNLRPPDMIVDAIFGTGFSGRVEGIQKSAIEWINRQSSFVVSVDIASGVNASSGKVENLAVQADRTVTMGLPKIGHYLGEGREHAGSVVPVDISLPASLLRSSGKKNGTYLVEQSEVSASLPTRRFDAHKYSVGKVFILAGSRGLAGAPFLTAQAAMRAGAGAVILGVPKGIHMPILKKVSEVMVIPLDETTEGTVAESAIPAIKEKVGWADVVAIGPGLTTQDETVRVIRTLVQSCPKPMVIDADGLNSLAGATELVKRRRHGTVLTPHIGEFRRLIGGIDLTDGSEKIELLRKTALNLNATIVLKGAPTLTGTSSGTIYVNSTGNPGLATAGSGDVLTGVIASLAAQGMDMESASYAGVYIHGLSGDIGAAELGERSVMASDLIRLLPDALKSVKVK